MSVLNIERKEHVDSDNRIDELEKALVDIGDLFEMPLQHSFIPGYYIRTIFMPKSNTGIGVVTTLIHNSEHCFNVSKGKVFVQINMNEWEEIEAPYWGKTLPGTRRVLLIAEDCTWTTFHYIEPEDQPKDSSEESIKEAVDKIVKKITIPHVNKHVGGVLKNNVIHNTIENENVFY